MGQDGATDIIHNADDYFRHAYASATAAEGLEGVPTEAVQKFYTEHVTPQIVTAMLAGNHRPLREAMRTHLSGSK